MPKKKLLIPCLMGPTASGKTDIACQLSDKYPFNIISVDSALIYRGMNIGTAKPDEKTLERYPHALINLCDPTAHYSVGQFCTDVDASIQTIVHQQHHPLLVGGTMMYFNALFKGLSALPSANQKIREHLSHLLTEHGSQYLHDELKRVDPLSAARIHPNDPQRIQRALEIFQITGVPQSELWQASHSNENYTYLKIAIAPQDRKILHERIAQRFNHMLEQGFIDEVKTLLDNKTLTKDLPALRCVGYRQVIEYLEGACDFNTMKERGIAATRQLAKRQLTWLRSFEDIYWFDSLDPDIVTKIGTLIEAHIVSHHHR
jgi:tRNA dimethylallyltransferase